MHAGPALSSQTTPSINHLSSLVTADGNAITALDQEFSHQQFSTAGAGRVPVLFRRAWMHAAHTYSTRARISSRHLLHATTSPTNAPFVGMYAQPSRSFTLLDLPCIQCHVTTSYCNWRDGAKRRKETGRAFSKQPRSTSTAINSTACLFLTG